MIFHGKAVSNGALNLFRMFASYQLFATYSQPRIEIEEVLKPGCWCKKPFSDIANLVLDQAFFPTGRWRVCDRLKQVVVCQRKKTTVKLTFFANKYGINYGLEIIANYPFRHVTKIDKRANLNAGTKMLQRLTNRMI